MGRCGQQRAPHFENDVSDLEEAAANEEDNLLRGLDLIEQIIDLLPDGIGVMINLEEVFNVDEEGILMTLPHLHEEYVEEDYYPDDSDNWRQLQLKSGLVSDQYDDNYPCLEAESSYPRTRNDNRRDDWSCEGEQEEFDDYSTDGALMPFNRSDQLFQRLSALPFSSELYYDDPLAQEEIAVEILELEHLVNSEFLASSLETNHLGMPDEDFIEYCNELEE